MIFGKYTELCNCHHSLMLEHLYHPQKKAGVCMWSLSNTAPAPSTSNLCSFFILGAFYINGMIAHMYDFGDWLLSLSMVLF